MVISFVICARMNVRVQDILEGSLQLPAIIFGAGTFSNQYNTDEHLTSDVPFRTVRLAFRYVPRDRGTLSLTH